MTDPPDALAYTNRQLFSNHFLENRLRTFDLWHDSLDHARALRRELGDLYAANRAQLATANERQTEERWIIPVLRAMGWAYEVQPRSQRHGSTQFPDFALFPSQADADAAAGTDRANVLRLAHGVLEAKRWNRSLEAPGTGDDIAPNRIPSSQIINYLIRAGKPWGILTNGQEWRLYYRDADFADSVFFAVDLPALLGDGRLTLPETGLSIDPDEAFLYFLRFFAPEAFRSGIDGVRWLDSVRAGSAEYARAVEDALKPRAYRSVTALCRGLASSTGVPPESLREDPELADRILDNALTLLFRLLFILYAESRDLLPVHSNSAYRNKSLLSLRERVRRIRDGEQGVFPHGRDLWRDLHDLFEIVDGQPEWRQVGVPVYNGGLFDPAKHPWLEAHHVPDADLAEALDLLSRVDDPVAGPEYVDYGPLDVRHLGSIYEGLLEYRLRVAEEDLPAVREGRIVVRDPVPAGSLFLADYGGERHSTGSYYTPDYVVEYIVRRTLEPLVEGRAPDGVLALKVLDPAMGSGHFLVSATSFLARAAVAAEETESANSRSGRTPEDLRRLVVERCIFGVDRNPRAVELAKLALWLVTVQHGKPLNFLDHHLKCGDSLLGARISSLSAAPTAAGRERRMEAGGQFNAFHAAFTQRVQGMLALVNQIELLPSETLSDLQIKEGLHADADNTLERFRRVADLWCSAFFGNSLDQATASGQTARGAVFGMALDRLQAAPADWDAFTKSPPLDTAAETARRLHLFHWELEFAEVFFDARGNERDEPGFDAIIGNPPYVRMEAFREIKDFLRSEYQTYETRSDLYVYFMERSLELLRTGGRYGVIVSNKFLRANYGRPLRAYLARHAGIEQIVDLGGLPVFPEATVRAAIILAAKDRAVPSRFAELHDLQFDDLAVAVEAGSVPLGPQALEGEEWVLADVRIADVLERIREGLALCEHEALFVGRGIVTGVNAAFFVDDAIGRRLLSADPANREIVKPLVRGEDVRRWFVRGAREWMLYVPHGLDISRYPAIEAHLAQHREALEKRATTQEWFELQQPQEAYREHFEHNKIVFPDMAQTPRFAAISGAAYPANTCYFIPTHSTVLLLLLNSRLSLFFVHSTAALLEGSSRGDEYVRFQRQYVEQFPVPAGLPLDATGKGGDDIATWLRTLYHRGLRRAGVEPEIPEDVRALGRRIGEIEDVERVMLVGSWARGQATPDSDVDLLIICAENGGPKDWRRRIRSHLGRVDRPLDLTVFTPEQLDERARAAASTVREFLTDGIELYAAS